MQAEREFVLGDLMVAAIAVVGSVSWKEFTQSSQIRVGCNIQAGEAYYSPFTVWISIFFSF